MIISSPHPFGILHPSVTGDIVGTNVSLVVPFGTNVSSLVAVFSASNLASVSISSVNQESGVTLNNFSNALTYIVTAEDGTTKEYTITIIISQNQLGLNELESDKFIVYPNPSNGIFNLNVDQGQLKISVSDLNGKEIYNFNDEMYLENKFKLDLKEFEASFYFLKLFNNQVENTLKLEVLK